MKMKLIVFMYSTFNSTSVFLRKKKVKAFLCPILIFKSVRSDVCNGHVEMLLKVNVLEIRLDCDNTFLHI